MTTLEQFSPRLRSISGEIKENENGEPIKTSVVSVVFDGLPELNLQFIATNFDYSYGVVSNFDFDYVQCGISRVYDSYSYEERHYHGDVYVMQKCRRALKSKKIAKMSLSDTKAVRVAKVINKGFSIPIFMNDFHSQQLNQIDILHADDPKVQFEHQYDANESRTYSFDEFSKKFTITSLVYGYHPSDSKIYKLATPITFEKLRITDTISITRADNTTGNYLWLMSDGTNKLKKRYVSFKVVIDSTTSTENNTSQTPVT